MSKKRLSLHGKFHLFLIKGGQPEICNDQLFKLPDKGCSSLFCPLEGRLENNRIRNILSLTLFKYIEINLRNQLHLDVQIC